MLKQLVEALKSAKKIELFVIIAAVCTLLVIGTGDKTADKTIQDPQEQRLERILSQIEGAGDVAVMLSYEDAYPKGCVVASSGAEDMHIYLELQRAVKALTNLELEQIEIVKSKG